MVLARRIVLLLIVGLALTTYGISITNAEGALCFGRDGHRALEGAAEHRPAAVSPYGGLWAATGHGSCVDVALLARGTDSSHAVAPPVVAPIPPLAIVDGVAFLFARQDGRPLVPAAGFGSSVLRI